MCITALPRSLAAALALMLSACGYAPLRPGALFGETRLAVVPFAEASAVGLSPLLADHLARLLQSEGLTVMLNGEQAPLVLDGSLDLATRTSATRAGIESYRVIATVRAELRDREGELVWRGDSSASEDFMRVVGVDVQPLLTEANRRFALHRLAERCAHQVHEAMLLGAFRGLTPPAAHAPLEEDLD